MLKYYLCLYLLLYLIQSYSQSNLVFRQGFETEGDNWPIQHFSTEPCTIDGDTWNYHSELGGIIPSNGNSFWGIQDLNGNCGSSGFEFIELAMVNISDLRNVVISFDVQVKGYDNGDDIKYQLWMDGLPGDEVIVIDGQNDFSTEDWQRIDIPIPNQIKDVKLRISVKQNGSDTAALDHIRLTGTSIQKCEELFISEYIEGLSSTSFRNNFLELYNPSEDTVNLAEYSLIKYAGSNLEGVSLELSGKIPPYGTFLIEDITEQHHMEADISTNNAVMDYNGDDKIALEKSGILIDLIGIIGSSGNFAKDVCLLRKSEVQSPNSEYDPNEWDIYDLDYIKNLNTHGSFCEDDFPEIEVSGLGKQINDSDATSSLSNNTYFGAWPVSRDTIIVRAFSIKNTGIKDLNISAVNLGGQGNSLFSHDFQEPVSIVPNDSIILTVRYSPTSFGLHTNTLKILNNDPSEQEFEFVIQGEGTNEVNHPLIISQYYEGNSNNKWIEVSNIKNESSPADTYYLALYRNSETQNPIGSKPYRKILIPSIPENSSLKFSATFNVTMPEYALDGNEIKTSVCTFTGDDIILISTSDAEDCWVDRTDIIGKSGNWGSNLSLIRKSGCDASLPNTGFIESNWEELSIESVDKAITSSDARIGTYNSAQTIWSESGWTNGFPDTNKTAIISHNYITGIHGDLSTCSLIIEKNIQLIASAETSIEIKKDLLVDGLLEVENNASLIMIEDAGKIEVHGNIKIHKTTSSLRPLDYTFWSSPVESAQLENVFKASPKNSFFIFSTQEYSDSNNDSQDDNDNAWIGVSGVMEIGRGYTSMAPNPIPLSKNQKVVFEGPVNSGTIKIPIEKQFPISNSPAWNFIGNPYPSAINAESIFGHSQNMNLLYGTLYFWTHETAANTQGTNNSGQYSSSDYAMYTIGVGGIKATKNGETPTNSISSCQGFFVEAKNSGTLTLNNSMREKENNTHFFKPISTKKETKLWLNLTYLDGAFSQVLIGFNKYGKIDFDKNYDGIRIVNTDNLHLYSIVKKEKLGIQSLPPFSGHEQIKLGFIPNNYLNKTLKISVDHIEGGIKDFDIILSDNHLQKKHLLNHIPYSFSIDKSGPCDDRFELSFTNKELVESNHIETKLNWNLNDDYLLVKTNTSDRIERIEVFDLNGRKLRDVSVTNDHAYINWHGLPRRAIYILKVQLKDRRKLISKILI
ncbi:lamin tail domain-containing protein [Lutimonas sp.]|uniref:lamin tail domain-containing protein n=1 Tax=Lutimonas sp. TaxID=1872403 RepID=UPI003D9BB207